jgi:hypothetical protein
VPERVGSKVLPIPTKSQLLLRERPEALGEEQEPPRMYAGEVSDVPEKLPCSLVYKSIKDLFTNQMDCIG